MSILIKDVKAPRDCASCKMPMEICSLWVGSEPGIKHQDCPIVELPEKHGRLIDADALKDKWTNKDLDLFSQGWGWLRDLNQAPTIIPASEEATK